MRRRIIYNWLFAWTTPSFWPFEAGKLQPILRLRRNNAMDLSWSLNDATLSANDHFLVQLYVESFSSRQSLLNRQPQPYNHGVWLYSPNHQPQVINRSLRLLSCQVICTYCGQLWPTHTTEAFSILIDVIMVIEYLRPSHIDLPWHDFLYIMRPFVLSNSPS